MEYILPSMTTNVAALLKLHNKGRLEHGNDADLLVLDSQFNVQHVMARGRWHVRDQRAVIRGTYEST
jgi:beta-aspartyl-dipeptidase (metallo-type)